MTYNRDIAPIVFAHCAECHRPGEVAPFSLLTYQDAAKRAQGLARVTGRRLMPPWKADIHYGEFLDERRLTERQIALIKTWAEHGAPEGDAADLPPQPTFTLRLAAGQARPGCRSPRALHGPGRRARHLSALRDSAESQEGRNAGRLRVPAGQPLGRASRDRRHRHLGGAGLRDAETPEPGWRTSGSIDASITGILGVWTPGMTPRFYSDNVGVALDKKADVVVQLHLHPSGKKETDQSKIALYFAKKPVKRIMSRRPLLLGTLIIEVPPGQSQYHTGSTVTLPADVTLISVFPHMHLIGKEMKITATLPDKTVKPLIWIKDWNFYWQDSYVYQQPVHLARRDADRRRSLLRQLGHQPVQPQHAPQACAVRQRHDRRNVLRPVSGGRRRTRAGRGMGLSMMRSFMEQWNTAHLSPDARTKIFAEAMKLFGGRRRIPAPAVRKKWQIVVRGFEQRHLVKARTENDTLPGRFSIARDAFSHPGFVRAASKSDYDGNKIEHLRTGNCFDTLP